MYRRDTIAALSTATGAAAVAVVRVSGDAAEAIARRVFRGLPPERWPSHRMMLGRFVDAEERTLDRGLGVLMRAPHSYTGEDVLELHGHGGIVVARSLLAAVLGAGARAAERGEFTLRAFLNGKLDLAQAESVADLIAAPTDEAMRAAAIQLDGSLSRTVESLRDRLVGVAAQLEVSIDFSEEDVPALDRDKLADECRALEREMLALAATHARGRILREGLHVAIVGKPNVGKSSLMNRLLGVERAIVTAIPGTTRDVIEEALDIDGIAVVLADTAGVRAEAEEVERIGIERTRARIETADLVLIVLDGSRQREAEDEILLDATRYKERILLINKMDLSQKLQLPELLDAPVAVLSALTGEGFDALRAAIARHADRVPGFAGLTILRERQQLALEASAAATECAAASLAADRPSDVIAVDIMIALDHLGEIVGHTCPEVVLDRIFSEFCIGK